jgi:hypothetical protein
LRNHWIKGLSALAVTLSAAILITACGSSSSGGGGGSGNGNAQSLLKQTFSGEHKVNSGNLQFALSVTPSGSSTLTKPITLSFGGPFQSLGKGKLPESNFTVGISAQGHTGSLSIVSTGTEGFVTLSGVSYQLPAASFQKLESSFSSIASSGSVGSSGSKTGTLSKLGINPLNWLEDPSVVGSENIGGSPTTHISAKVNVPALLRDLNTFLQKASSLGVAGASKIPSSISAASQTKIASEIKSPSFDVWTGNSDKTVRKLSVGINLPVSGQISSLLGGMSGAGITLSLQYTDLNQSQTITAPTNVQPYSEFSSKLAALLQTVESTVASGALGSSTSGAATGNTGSTSSGSGAASSAAGATSSYSQCITAAGQDVTKMQKCGSLLSGSSGG